MMHKFFFVICFLSLGVLGFSPCFGQANSVELRSSTALISTHASITDAYAAIPATINQPYLIELTNAYTGASETVPVTFTTRTGASAINTITLRPKAGVSALSLSANLPGSSIIILDNTDYMIIDGRPGGMGNTGVVSIQNTGIILNTNTISLINGATHNIIRNISLSNSTSVNGGRNLLLGTSPVNNSGNSDNQLLYITTNGGRFGINSYGSTANPNTRNRVYGCTMINSAFAGFWSQEGTAKITVDSCQIYHNSPVGYGGTYGILMDVVTDTITITRNKVFDLENQAVTSNLRGISVRTTLATGVNLTRIYNNFIALRGNTHSTSLIGIEYAGSNTTNGEVYFNTVRISGTVTASGTSGNVGSAAFSKTAYATSNNIKLKNNLFVNERTGGTSGLQHLAMSLTDLAGTIISDYNTYNASATLIRAGSNLYTSVAAYQAVAGAGNEVNSNSTAVQFVSATDLHLAGTSVGNTTLLGLSIAGITVDIDNQVRGTSTYRGADEATPLTTGPTISSTLNNRSGVKATVEQNFNVSTTAGASAGQLVRIKITLANPAQASNISLSYEATPGNFLPLVFDASGVALIGPATGFPLANATTALKGTFNAAGTYNYSLALINAGTGANLAAPTAESVNVSAFVPATISSNLNNRANVVTNRQESFVVTTIANNNAGRQVKGKVTLTNPAQAANVTMSYETTTPGTYVSLTFNASGEAEFGPIPGFTLANATTNFRAVFNAPGTYAYTISLVDATTGTLVGTALAESVTILVNGLKAEQLARDISLFPNPASDKLTIQLPEARNVELTVLDITGKQILNAKPATNETNFNLESLPAGTYLLQVKTEDAIATKRFVVIK